MKHWNELTELETEIIRVSEFKNLFKLLVAGTENYVDIKVLQSAIYTMETMIDDIDSTLYEKFQTVWDAVRDEDTEPEEEYRFENGQPFVTISKKKHKAVNESTTSVEEDEAFRDLEKALKTWRKATP